jgi:hypothetical protein
VLLVAPLLGSIAKWAQFGTQFRPDPTAVALFCACLVLVTHDSGTVDPAGSRGARLRAFAGGVCFTLATWASQKVVIYGLAFPLLWLVSCWQQLREPSGPRSFRAPLALALGVLAGAVPIAVYLTVTRNWAPLYHWCFEWGVVHETVYPRRDAMRSLWPSLEQAPHVFVLGGVGLALTLRALVREGMTRALHDPDLLVVLAALGTLLSYFMQNAPFGWSAICWFTFTALFAARALAELIAWAQQRFAGGPLPGVAMAATLLVAGAQLPVRSPPPAPGLPPRSVQDELFTHIVQLTAPSDPVYDNTGRAITRPHAHFLFFTDKTARIALKDQLNREIPKAIRARGVTVRLLDERDEALPQPLREFVDAHFVEVLPDLALWGQRYRGLARGASAELEAVRTAQYYVSPGNVVRSHQLRVDGRELREPVLKLVAGMHVLQWQGERPAPAFNVIWLPRNRARLPPR